MKNVILASASARRRELVGLLPFSFEFQIPKGEEAPDPALTPEENVLALARAKAFGAGGEGDIVVGCDTVVVLGGEILGKPKDARDAARMLRGLSGKAHRVLTGVYIRCPEGRRAFYEETAVYFRVLSDAEIDGYVKSGEPMDKAGAYGIQGGASVFVRRIEGDYFNVVGLPLCRLYEELKKLGL